MKLDNAMKGIVSRQALIDFIKKLPDDARGVLVVSSKSTGDTKIAFIGDAPMKDLLEDGLAALVYTERCFH